MILLDYFWGSVSYFDLLNKKIPDTYRFPQKLDINLFATKFKAKGFLTVRMTSYPNHVNCKSALLKHLVIT